MALFVFVNKLWIESLVMVLIVKEVVCSDGALFGDSPFQPRQPTPPVPAYLATWCRSFPCAVGDSWMSQDLMVAGSGGESAEAQKKSCEA